MSELYPLGSSNHGEQTSAQWFRFAFHDFVTVEAATETGHFATPNNSFSTLANMVRHLIPIPVFCIRTISTSNLRLPEWRWESWRPAFYSRGCCRSIRISFIYNLSDNNQTIESMFEDATFHNNCNSLFEKMINIVPTTVKLSDAVKPMEWKAVDIMMDISSTGDASISGLLVIRHLYTTTQPPKTVSYTLEVPTGNSSTTTTCESSGSGTSVFGLTTYWPFNNTVARFTEHHCLHSLGRCTSYTMGKRK